MKRELEGTGTPYMPLEHVEITPHSDRPLCVEVSLLLHHDDARLNDSLGSVAFVK